VTRRLHARTTRRSNHPPTTSDQHGDGHAQQQDRPEEGLWAHGKCRWSHRVVCSLPQALKGKYSFPCPPSPCLALPSCGLICPVKARPRTHSFQAPPSFVSPCSSGVVSLVLIPSIPLTPPRVFITGLGQAHDVHHGLDGHDAHGGHAWVSYGGGGQAQDGAGCLGCVWRQGL